MGLTEALWTVVSSEGGHVRPARDDGFALFLLLLPPERGWQPRAEPAASLPEEPRRRARERGRRKPCLELKAVSVYVCEALPLLSALFYEANVGIKKYSWRERKASAGGVASRVRRLWQTSWALRCPSILAEVLLKRQGVSLRAGHSTCAGCGGQRGRNSSLPSSLKAAAIFVIPRDKEK